MMIVYKGKAIPVAQAESLLEEMTEQRQAARDELEEAEQKISECEKEIYDYDRGINEILDQMKATDLSSALPSNMWRAGFCLTEVLVKEVPPAPADLFGALPVITSKLTILADKSGEEVGKWGYNPSLTDLMELARRL